MLIVDVVFLVLLLLAVLTGVRMGLFSSLGALVGSALAVLTLPWVMPAVARFAAEQALPVIVVVAVGLLLLFVGGLLGASAGSLLRRGADELSLRVVERALGGVVGLVLGAALVSISGSAVISAGVTGVSAPVASSEVLRTIDRFTPEAWDRALAKAESEVLSRGVLPTIDGLLEEVDLAAAPDLGEVDTDNPHVAEAAQSVARISGVASACSISSSGTGFVVAEDLVLTNAHVLAGVSSPLVELPGEPAREGTVVHFDPSTDLALISVDVDAEPLRLGDGPAGGDAAVVHGYPYGGPARTGAAGVVATATMRIPNIYDQAPQEREVVTVRAEVDPGNSGGPLLSEDGTVIGVLFAQDTARADIGYALTTAEVRAALEAAGTTEDPAPTGDCQAA